VIGIIGESKWSAMLDEARGMRLMRRSWLSRPSTDRFYSLTERGR
jgi:hypothetical protein